MNCLEVLRLSVQVQQWLKLHVESQLPERERRICQKKKKKKKGHSGLSADFKSQGL